MRVRRVLTVVVGLLAPKALKPFLLRALGHHVEPGVRIGFSVLRVQRLYLARGTRIGHLNFLGCRRLVMRENAYIQHMNVLRGPFSVRLAKRAAIGTRNIISRAAGPISYGPAHLVLGELSKITSTHTLDLMRSIRFGDFTTVAGKGSQFWTHGYYHHQEGPGRFRVDGRIEIGDNVYIGSACIVSLAVRIGNGITVGSHSSVSKSLVEPGMYVSQPLRHIPVDVDAVTAKLDRLPPDVGGEIVYEKPLR